MRPKSPARSRWSRIRCSWMPIAELRLHQVVEGGEDELDPKGAAAALDVGAEASRRGPRARRPRPAANDQSMPCHVGRGSPRWRQLEVDQVVDADIGAGVDLAVEGPGVLEVVEGRLDGGSSSVGVPMTLTPMTSSTRCFSGSRVMRPERMRSATSRSAAPPTAGRSARWGMVSRSRRRAAGSAGRQRSGPRSSISPVSCSATRRDTLSAMRRMRLRRTMAASRPLRQGDEAHADRSAREKLLRQLAVPVDELGDPGRGMRGGGDDRRAHLVLAGDPLEIEVAAGGRPGRDRRRNVARWAR